MPRTRTHINRPPAKPAQFSPRRPSRIQGTALRPARCTLPAVVRRVSRGSALFGRFADQRIIMLQHRRQANKHMFAHQCPGLLDPGA